MKYLKKYKLFEKSEDELLNFSKACLFNGRAGWLEEDFRIETYEVCLQKTLPLGNDDYDFWAFRVKLLTDRVLSDRVWGGDGFNWEEIKDEYISYIQLLKDENIKIIGYDSEYGKMLDNESVEIFFQKGKREHKRVYYKVVPIEELDNLKLDNIIYINIYLETDWHESINNENF
jgi:hypothetical protein